MRPGGKRREQVIALPASAVEQIRRQNEKPLEVQALEEVEGFRRQLEELDRQTGRALLELGVDSTDAPRLFALQKQVQAGLKEVEGMHARLLLKIAPLHESMIERALVFLRKVQAAALAVKPTEPPAAA